MVEHVSASDERPTRLRALFDRIGALPDASLPGVERAVATAEGAVPPEPGTTRVVAGAIVTERPDLVYHTSISTGEIREVDVSGRSAMPADVAPEGMSRR